MSNNFLQHHLKIKQANFKTHKKCIAFFKNLSNGITHFYSQMIKYPIK